MRSSSRREQPLWSPVNVYGRGEGALRGGHKHKQQRKERRSDGKFVHEGDGKLAAKGGARFEHKRGGQVAARSGGLFVHGPRLTGGGHLKRSVKPLEVGGRGERQRWDGHSSDGVGVSKEEEEEGDNEEEEEEDDEDEDGEEEEDEDEEEEGGGDLEGALEEEVGGDRVGEGIRRSKGRRGVQAEACANEEEDDDDDSAELDDGDEEDGNEGKEEEEEEEEDEEDGSELDNGGEEEIQEEMKDIPFEVLRELHSDGRVTAGRKGGGGGGSREAETHKRANKNRPMELSSKKPVSTLRDVVQAPKKVPRDPRFETLAGRYDPHVFRSTYRFIFDERLPEEKRALQKALEKEKDVGRAAAIKRQLAHLTQELQGEQSRRRQEVVEVERRRKEREAVRGGKRPFYMKKSEKRRMELLDKFKELKASGKLEKYLAKRRQRNAAKDHRFIPHKRARTQDDTD